MARSALDASAIQEVNYGGINITDLTTDTIATGDDNGFTFDYVGGSDLLIVNDTGGPAAVTIKIPSQTNLTTVGVTTPDKEITIADGKTYLWPVSTVFKQSDSKIYVDCDVAAKFALLK